MKLKLSIPTRPRLIHMLSIVDLLALFFVFPLLVNQFAPSGGHELVLTQSPLRLPAEDYAVSIKVQPSDDSIQVWVNQDIVPLDQLSDRLHQIREEWTHGGEPIAWFKQDKSITLEQSTQVLNVLFENQFRVLQVGDYYKSKLKGG